MIAAGADNVLAALKAIRALSGATIVLKRGAKGCIVYDGPISDDLEAGIVGKGFPIEVYNVLGAGDAFMSGFLRGWLQGRRPRRRRATWANACGAFAVSRLLCSPEYPTWAELKYFLEHGSPERALRKDDALNHIHWATTRRREIPLLMALAIDHRIQLEDLARGRGGAGAHSRLQGAGGQGGPTRRRRAPRLRHAARRQVWPRRAVRRRRRTGPVGGEADRAAGLAAAAVRVQPGHRQPADRMAGRSLHQGAVLLSSGRRRGAEAPSRPPSSSRPSRRRARSAASS